MFKQWLCLTLSYKEQHSVTIAANDLHFQSLTWQVEAIMAYQDLWDQDFLVTAIDEITKSTMFLAD